MSPQKLGAIDPPPEPASFPSRRSVVYSTKGMVACSQPLAVQAGLQILREGGNAAVGHNSSGHQRPEECH